MVVVEGGMERHRRWCIKLQELQFRQRKLDDRGQEPDDPGGSTALGDGSG